MAIDISSFDEPKSSSIDITSFDEPKAKGIDISSFDSTARDPTLGEIGAGLVADVALAEGIKYAGAAGGAALGSAVPVVGNIVGGALGYAGGAVVGGVSGSIAAQKLEGREDISWGRVVGDTLLNFIPGSKLAKTGSVGARVLKAGAVQGAIGAVTAPAAQSVESLIETGKMPEKDELLKMAAMGGTLGFGLGSASVGLEKVFGKIGGKTTDQIDEMVATGDIKYEDIKEWKLISDATTASKEKPAIEFNIKKEDSSNIFGKGTEEVVITDPATNGKIVVVNRPDGVSSVTDLFVPEASRGMGVGEQLQNKALEMFPKLQGQVSSKAAATTAYRLGRRPYENPNATLEDVFKIIDKNSSVNLISNEAQPEGSRKILSAIDIKTTPKSVLAPQPTNEGLLRRELESTAQRKSAEIAAAEIINAYEIAKSGNGVLGKIWASIAPSRVVGRKSQQAAIDYSRSVKEAEELGSRLARNLEKRIGGDKATNDLVNKLLDGEPVPITKEQYIKLGSSLADIQKYQEMRRELQDKMSNLLDEGAYKNLNEEGRAALQEAIQDSIGGPAYNRREYKIFLDPKFQEDPKLAAAALAELSQKMGPEKAKDHMNKLRNASAAVQKEDPRSYFGAPVDSILRKRHNPSIAERAWLGEVTEAPERIRGSLSGMGKSVARAEADSRIIKSLLGDNLASKVQAPGMVQLVLRGTGPDGTGVFVNPEVQVALKNIYLPKADAGTENIVVNALQDLYRASVAGSKASKVLLNTIAYPVQLYGNTTSLLGMGINPFSKTAIRGADIALAEFGGIEALRKSPAARKELLDEIQEMARYGIKNANIIASDLRNTLDDGIFSKVVGKVTDPLGKAYSVPDTMGRYVGWKANQNTLRKLFPEASDELIKREAAHLINDTYQNYDKLSNVVRTLSRWGVMPQFASFTAEFARNQYNQGIVLSKMLAGTYKGVEDMGQANVGAMRREGAKRLAALTAVYGGTYGAIEGVKAASGLTQEDQDALRDLAYAPWDKNREQMVSYDKETRKGWTANPSYIIPHAIGLSAFKAGMRGDDEASVIGMIGEELIGEGSFVMQEAFRAIENRNKYGKSITNELDDVRAASDKIKYFIAETFRPGVSREFKKFAEAKRGAGDLTLKQVGQRQLGLRSNAFDVNDAAKFAVGKSYGPSKDEAARYYSLLKYDQPSDQEANAAYGQAERINQESFSALVQNVKSMKQLNFTEGEVIRTMKDAGVSSEKILHVLGENYRPLSRVKIPSLSDTYDNLTGGLQDKRKAIMDIRKEDRELGEKLMNRWEKERKAERSGITSKDSLIRGLDTMQKVSYINGQPNPSATLQDLRRNGLVSDEVVRAVRLSN